MRSAPSSTARYVCTHNKGALRSKAHGTRAEFCFTVGCKRAVRNQDFGFHFTFRPQVFFRPQILALSPLKESQQRRNQDHSKALALKIEIDMPYALVEPQEAYPRGK